MNKIIIMIATVVAMVGSVSAQIVPNLDEGTKALDLSGSLDTDHPLDYQWTLQGGYGVFLSDGFLVGILAGVQDNDLITTYEIGARTEYNFVGDSQWVPYVGAAVLWAAAEVDGDGDSDSDLDGVLGRVTVGVKYFLSNDVAIALDGAYDMASEDIFTNQDGESEDSNFQILLGMRFYFD